MPDWFFRGGIAMWPLLVCSIAGLAIILERVWALQRRRIISPSWPRPSNSGRSRPSKPRRCTC